MSQLVHGVSRTVIVLYLCMNTSSTLIFDSSIDANWEEFAMETLWIIEAHPRVHYKREEKRVSICNYPKLLLDTKNTRHTFKWQLVACMVTPQYCIAGNIGGSWIWWLYGRPCKQTKKKQFQFCYLPLFNACKHTLYCFQNEPISFHYNNHWSRLLRKTLL